MQAAKGHNTGPAEDGSKRDPRAIMQAKEIKAARLKDKSAMKSELLLYEGDWRCQRIDGAALPYRKQDKRCYAHSGKINVHLLLCFSPPAAVI